MGMTLDELQTIKEVIRMESSNVNSCQCVNCRRYRFNALEIIEREINLKTMDVRKSSEINCTCGKNSSDKGLIFTCDPSCPKHGIAQQLNKSQME